MNSARVSRCVLGLLGLVASSACFRDHQRHEDAGMDAQVEADASRVMDAAQDAASHWLDGAPMDAALDASMDAALDPGRDAAGDAELKDASDADAAFGDAGPAYPPLLSQTNLFADLASETLADGVRAFEPNYMLWSDGATKRRWIFLPPGTQIDTADADHWIYPVGTKAWKEFTRDGVRVETRLLHKVAVDSWISVAYQWRADLSEADAVPAGVLNANGTPHDIPDTSTCLRCHGGMPDKLLGFTAVQLMNFHEGAYNLPTLVNENRISVVPSVIPTLPGTELERAALGYLHANCGHCHNPTSAVWTRIKNVPPNTGGPRFWENVYALASVEETEGYLSTVDQPNSVLPDLSIIEPGNSSQSEMFLRMGQRGVGTLQMPPVGTELVDDAGMATVRAWIESLPVPDGGVEDGEDAGEDAGDGG